MTTLPLLSLSHRATPPGRLLGRPPPPVFFGHGQCRCLPDAGSPFFPSPSSFPGFPNPRSRSRELRKSGGGAASHPCSLGLRRALLRADPPSRVGTTSIHHTPRRRPLLCRRPCCLDRTQRSPGFAESSLSAASPSGSLTAHLPPAVGRGPSMLQCSSSAAAPQATWAWRRRCLQMLPAAPVPSLRAVAVCPARRHLGEWSPTSPRPLSCAGGEW
jgi:hypothetical protein